MHFSVEIPRQAKYSASEQFFVSPHACAHMWTSAARRNERKRRILIRSFITHGEY